MQIEGFEVIDENPLVLFREYAFSKGAYATTLVFRGTDGLVVVSPGSGVTARELDALKEHGEVTALVANNAFHHLGQGPWREHFPNAKSYAPSGALERLRKKAPAIPFRPLSELALPSGVEAHEIPGFKQGEAFFSIRTSRGTLWFTGDLLTNIQKTPGPPVRWLFSWTGSAPGYRLFRPAVWLLVRDKKAVRAWMLDRLASDPPALIVPAHGPLFADSDLPALTRAQLERL
jgi:glyoxylase-like metal-dependent hydrolase (beta-lactamase superfamily II)